jgi:hypothetical protein
MYVAVDDLVVQEKRKEKKEPVRELGERVTLARNVPLTKPTRQQTPALSCNSSSSSR